MPEAISLSCFSIIFHGISEYVPASFSLVHVPFLPTQLSIVASLFLSSDAPTQTCPQNLSTPVTISGK